MDIRLDGRRALVTGAGRGIGAAIAHALAEAGARVAVNDLHAEGDAATVVHEIESKGGQAMVAAADISDSAQVEAMFASIDAAWDGLDILVNNAGIDGPHALSWEADPKDWRRVIDIDLIGAFECSRRALKRMVAQGHGVVLSITSVHEVIAWSGYSAYAAAKAGAGMMMKTMAQEAGPYGVRVLGLAPGAVKTNINENVWSDPAGMADLLTKIPLGRMAEPQDIANMAVVLASDAAAYVTGTTVFVDGAMTDYPSFAHGG